MEMGRSERRSHLAILVLGDLGRSPRMCYHSLAAAAEGAFTVSLIGVAGSKLPNEILSSENIHVHLLPPPLFKSRPPRVLYPLAAMFKLVLQTIQLLHVLLIQIPQPDILLVQTPPALPTLPLCRLVSWLRRSALVVDWHNLGYSLMELSLRKGHPLVALASTLERRFGREAAAHFCVTQAMKDFLEVEWKVQPSPVVLPDMPAELFRKLDFAKQRYSGSASNSSSERDDALETLLDRYGKEWDESWPGTVEWVRQVQRGVSDQRSTLLIMTGTSWTPDEDIEVLICALQRYDAEAADQGIRVPNLTVFITGRGPLQARYEESIRLIEWQHIRICTTFLAMADYAKLVAASDFVVSLHVSSSGVDLPMKVLDACGSGRPVLAAEYACINELVEDGQTGLLFKPREDALCAGLIEMATNMELRETLAQRVVTRFTQSFEETWKKIAMPLLQEFMALGNSGSAGG